MLYYRLNIIDCERNYSHARTYVIFYIERDIFMYSAIDKDAMLMSEIIYINLVSVFSDVTQLKQYITLSNSAESVHINSVIGTIKVTYEPINPVGWSVSI